MPSSYLITAITHSSRQKPSAVLSRLMSADPSIGIVSFVYLYAQASRSARASLIPSSAACSVSPVRLPVCTLPVSSL